MIEINLMPPEEKKETGVGVPVALPKNLTNILLAVPIVLTLGGVGFWYVTTQNEIERLTEEKLSAETRLKELEKQIAEVKELEERQNQLKKRIETITKLNSNRDFWRKALVDLAERMPSEFFSFTSMTELAVENGRAVTINGFALTDLKISEYITSLRSSEYVVDVNLANTRAGNLFGREVRLYTMTIYLKVPGGTPVVTDAEEDS